MSASDALDLGSANVGTEGAIGGEVGLAETVNFESQYGIPAYYIRPATDVNPTDFLASGLFNKENGEFVVHIGFVNFFNPDCIRATTNRMPKVCAFYCVVQ